VAVLQRDYAEVDELLKLLVSLIRAKSENPPGFEREAAEVVIDFLTRNGLKFEVYEKEEGRTNVVCTIGSGRPNLAFICHLDVVPAGSGWSKPPYEGVIEGGRVYGRGSTDNKGALASVLVAASSVKGDISSGSVTIMAVADEEQGNTYGIDYLIKEVGVKPDYAIVCEPTSCNTIVVAEKGILRIKLTSRGKLAHGSRPHEGVNAIVKLSKVVARLEGFKMSFEEHPLFSPPTLNVGVISGGEAVNVVPSLCTCMLDIRYLPTQTPTGILKEIEELIGDVRRSDPLVDVTAEITEVNEPLVTPLDHPLVKLVIDSSLRCGGPKPMPVGIGGGTVAKPLSKAGVRSVVYGPGDEFMCHKADEYIEISQLKLAVNVYRDIMLNFTKYLKV